MSEKFDIEKHITFRKKRINQATISNPLLPGLAVVEINPTLDTENKMAGYAFDVINAVVKSIEKRK